MASGVFKWTSRACGVDMFRLSVFLVLLCVAGSVPVTFAQAPKAAASDKEDKDKDKDKGPQPLMGAGSPNVTSIAVQTRAEQIVKPRKDGSDAGGKGKSALRTSDALATTAAIN